MRRTAILLIALATALSPVALTGTTTAEDWLPVLSQIDVEPVANVAFSGGAGLRIHGDYAFSGAQSGGLYISDISDPENPVLVTQLPCRATQNDIQIQGDLLLVAADGNGSCTKPDGGKQMFAGTAVLDFSDPRNPTYLSHLQYSRGSHNHTFVPGKPAPRLVTREMVERMRPGSVLIDLAAEEGGNCELTRPDEEVVHQGVRILGSANLPSTLPGQASALYARNIFELAKVLVADGAVRVDRDDEVVAAATLTTGGQVVHEPTAQQLEGSR